MTCKELEVLLNKLKALKKKQDELEEVVMLQCEALEEQEKEKAKSVRKLMRVLEEEEELVRQMGRLRL